MVKGRSKPPSRTKYEATHPVISIRISRELYQELKELSNATGKSFSDFLKDGAGITQSQIKHGKLVCLFCQTWQPEDDCLVMCRECGKSYRENPDDLKDITNGWLE